MRTRPGFGDLIALFLLRVPSVWAGGVATAVVLSLLIVEVGPGAAVAGALVAVALAVRVESVLDRRRGIGRRRLFRGPSLSPRRVAALVVALVLIASTSTALAMRLVSSVQQTAAAELRLHGSRDIKRGYY
jgi:hypothetical protein